VELIENLSIGDGEAVLIGSPSRPFEDKIKEEYLRIAMKSRYVIEAHLPQCFVVNVMKKPNQVFVVVIKNEEFNQRALSELTATIKKSQVLQDAIIWGVNLKSKFLLDIRASKCQIYTTPSSRWKFWNK